MFDVANNLKNSCVRDIRVRHKNILSNVICTKFSKISRIATFQYRVVRFYRYANHTRDYPEQYYNKLYKDTVFLQ